ncbi:hypothetical protein M9435_000101 [Picochlorum sp. BPE23]|nr:hypothetical protein M9435_000101 [Picochlorum sp. BPE23]
MLFVWLVSMPVDASWLVLVASQENGVLVGEQGWADTLPLAVSGLFEPWVSAVQIVVGLAIFEFIVIQFLSHQSS